MSTELHLHRLAARLGCAEAELSAVRTRVLAVVGAGGWSGPAHDEFVRTGTAVAGRLGILAAELDQAGEGTCRLAARLESGVLELTGGLARTVAGAMRW